MDKTTPAFSKRAFWTAVAIAVLMTVTAAFFAARYLTLQRTVAEREAEVPGFLPRYSLLSTSCEDRLSSRFKSWMLGIDVCDPWL